MARAVRTDRKTGQAARHTLMPPPTNNSTDMRLPWLLGIPGMALALVWGFAEGSFFFIVPDVVISLTALFSIKRSLQQMGLVVIGSLLAGILLFQWSQADYPA